MSPSQSTRELQQVHCKLHNISLSPEVFAVALKTKMPLRSALINSSLNCYKEGADTIKRPASSNTSVR